jgi:hypothetical protein
VVVGVLDMDEFEPNNELIRDGMMSDKRDARRAFSVSIRISTITLPPTTLI